VPTIQFDGPKMTVEQKKDLVASFSEAASRVTGIPKQAFVVYIRENDPENVGVGGELLLERKKREAKS
jgi:4-oxalocrotonate tautomerase